MFVQYSLILSSKMIERKPRSWPVHRNRLHTPPSVSVYLIYLLQSLPLVGQVDACLFSSLCWGGGGDPNPAKGP